jgi:hypothetical protein
MNPYEIKIGHCYWMTPVNGRRTIARVTNLFRITALAAYELSPVVVHFVWRHAAYPTGWSTRRQQLLLYDFVLAAEREVAGT